MTSRIVAVRKENVKFEGTVTYKFGGDRCDQFDVLENTNLVDGIGGVTWVILNVVSITPTSCVSY